MLKQEVRLWALIPLALVWVLILVPVGEGLSSSCGRKVCWMCSPLFEREVVPMGNEDES